MSDFFSSSSEGKPQIPDELKPLITNSANQIMALQNLLPLTGFAINTPQLTADLSNLQKYALERTPELGMMEPGYLGSQATMATIPELTSRPVNVPFSEMQARQGVNWLTNGPLGTAPATVAGMESWENMVKPQVQQELALAGLGRSGALGTAMAKSRTEAAVPLLQQEIENRMAVLPILQEISKMEQGREIYPREQTVKALSDSANMMRQLGDSTFNQQLKGIITQLQAGEIPRDVAEQQFERAYNDFLRLQALSEAATLGVFGSLAPSSIGFRQTNTPSGANMLGQGMGMFGSLLGMIGGLTSDRNVKRSVRPVDIDDPDILKKLRQLPVSTWNYKPGSGYDIAKRHIGPMAQDFHNIFETEGVRGPGDKGTISGGDVFGLVIAATKALDKRVTDMERGRDGVYRPREEA